MTKANVVITWATSVTVGLGDVSEEEAFSEDFDWKKYDATLIEYLDSLSEEELRGLYREPESIATDDPIFDTDDEPAVSMGENDE